MSRRRDVVSWAMNHDTSELPAEEMTTSSPAASDVMVACSVRLPLDVLERVKAAADGMDTSVSALVREWIQVGLADLDTDQTVSLAALRRAIAHLAERPNNAA